MKVLICGSRNINDPKVVSEAVEQSGMNATEIISGGARGVDTLARYYAQSNGIEFTEYLAEWDRFGKKAGYLRNIVMVNDADAVIAIWDGDSRVVSTVKFAVALATGTVPSFGENKKVSL